MTLAFETVKMSSAISDDVVLPSILGVHIRNIFLKKLDSYVRLWAYAVHFWQEVDTFLPILHGDRHTLRRPALTNMLERASAIHVPSFCVKL
jgi:hypothetical protein